MERKALPTAEAGVGSYGQGMQLNATLRGPEMRRYIIGECLPSLIPPGYTGGPFPIIYYCIIPVSSRF